MTSIHNIWIAPHSIGNVTLVVTAFATFFFAAIIWYTQILGYPLWKYVGRDEFLPLHREYLRRLPLIVQLPYGLLMLSNTLLLFYRPSSVSQSWSVTLWLLHFSILIISVGMAGPVHGQFYRDGYCEIEKLRRLIAYNALRTIIMTVSSSGMFYLLLRLLSLIKR